MASGWMGLVQDQNQVPSQTTPPPKKKKKKEKKKEHIQGKACGK